MKLTTRVEAIERELSRMLKETIEEISQIIESGNTERYDAEAADFIPNERYYYLQARLETLEKLDKIKGGGEN